MSNEKMRFDSIFEVQYLRQDFVVKKIIIDITCVIVKGSKQVVVKYAFLVKKLI